MMTATVTQARSRAQESTIRADLIERLQTLSSQQAKDVRDLLETLRTERSLDERREIAKTLTEILFPDAMNRSPRVSDDEIERRFRGRLDDYRTAVGVAVKQRREKLGLTQEDLAAKAGIPQSHVSRLERGKHIPTFATVEKVAKALKTKPSTLDPGFAD
jgi:ribosome-binding protein aMBF1 (putative translation factor)